MFGLSLLKMEIKMCRKWPSKIWYY